MKKEPMRLKQAFAIIEDITDITVMDSEKEEAIRTIMESDSRILGLSKPKIRGMVYWMYHHYMKEGRKDEALLGDTRKHI